MKRFLVPGALGFLVTLLGSVAAASQKGAEASAGKREPQVVRPSCAAFSHDGKLVAVGFTDSFPGNESRPSGRVIKVWDVKTLKEVQTLSGHEVGVHRVAFFPDGKRAISSGGDGYFRIWDTTTGSELGKVQSFFDSIAALSDDGKQLLSYGRGKLTLWRVDKEKVVSVQEHQAPPQGGRFMVALSRDASLALVDGSAHKIQLWDLHKGEVLKEFETKLLKESFIRGNTPYRHAVGLCGPVGFAPDKNFAVLGKRDKASSYLVLVHLPKGEEKRSFGDKATLWPRDVIVSPDGKRLVCRTDQGRMLSWDVESGKELWSIQDQRLSTEVFRFSPDARFALTAKGYRSQGTGDLEIFVWDTVEGKLVGPLSRPLFP